MLEFRLLAPSISSLSSMRLGSVVIAFSSDQIKTYGAGRDLSYPEWQTYLTQIVNLGYLSINYTDHSKLKLTSLSEAVLKGEKNIALFKFEKRIIAPKKVHKAIEVEDD